MEQTREIVATPAARVYEVEIPGGNHLPRWDKPLHEKSALPRGKVFADCWPHALSRVSSTMDAMDFGGTDLYRALSRAEGSDGAAGEALAAVGIRGLVYLDGGSRAAGTQNYVIFDGADTEIVGTVFRRSERSDVNE
jgi:hypothetical protein